MKPLNRTTKLATVVPKKQSITKIHFVTGLTLSIFVGLHLFNHFCSIFGPEKHIELMNMLRPFYRNLLVESILLIAVLVQIISGIALFKTQKRLAKKGFEKLHIYSGLYLALFLVIHLSAVLVGRLFLNLDTNFYFGVAGLNAFPFNLFFIPYYALAILSFFGHMAAIHAKKMTCEILNLGPNQQAKLILIFGSIVTIVLFYGLTNHFRGVEIPEEYNVLIGK